MATRIFNKRSATPASVPSTASLELGEIAINTYDGKLYIKKDDGAEAIVEIGAGGGGGLNNVVEDTTPELGGDLAANFNNISNINTASGARLLASAGTPYVDWYSTTSTADARSWRSYANSDTWYLKAVSDDNGTWADIIQIDRTTTTVDLMTIAPDLTVTGELTSGGTIATLGNFVLDIDQTVGVGQDNYVLTYDNGTGLISLEPAGGGGGLFTEDAQENIIGGTGAAANNPDTGVFAQNFIAGNSAVATATAMADSVYIGDNAGLNINTTEASNVAIGADAHAQSVTNKTGGSYGVFLGRAAGTNVKGDYCTFVGYQAGQHNTSGCTGNNNVGIGYHALHNTQQTSAANTAVGALCMDDALYGTSTDNTALGYAALPIMAGSSIVGATALGAQAGSKIYNGAGSVFIGYKAGPTVASTYTNVLYINNDESDTPLIHGYFSAHASGPAVTINGDLTVTGSLSGGGSGIANVVEDTTPQLGGDLDVNSHNIVGAPAASATSPGGAVNINGSAGGATSGEGGTVQILGGNATTSGFGGPAIIRAGNAAGTHQNGGVVHLTPGANTGLGNPGYVIINRQNDTGAVSALRFEDSGGNYTALKAANTVANIVTWTLPDDNPATVSGQYLTTDASGNLSFGTPASSGGTTWDGTDFNLVSTTAGSALISGGTNNVLLGDQSGNAITTGDNNICIGDNAGLAITTGSNNIAIGADAGLSAAGATTYTTHVGHQAGMYVTGTNSVAIGFHALLGNVTTPITGSGNTAVGKDALLNVEGAANHNIAMGTSAGNGITAGDYNICIGNLTGTALATAQYTVTVGHRSGEDRTANNGTFVGAQSGQFQTGGLRSTAFGYNAMQGSDGTGTSGNDNAAFGASALAVLEGTATRNVAIGNFAGSAITTGDDNIILGAYAGSNLTTGDNNLCIGDAAGPTTNTSNKLFIDMLTTDTPLIGGDFSAASVTINGSFEVTADSYFDAVVANTTAVAIDWTSGNIQSVAPTAAGNPTYVFTAPGGPARLTMIATNLGAAGTITWPGTVLWPGGTEPTWTASGTDKIEFVYDGTNYLGTADLAFA